MDLHLPNKKISILNMNIHMMHISIFDMSYIITSGLDLLTKEYRSLEFLLNNKKFSYYWWINSKLLELLLLEVNEYD